MSDLQTLANFLLERAVQQYHEGRNMQKSNGLNYHNNGITDLSSCQYSLTALGQNLVSIINLDNIFQIINQSNVIVIF